MREAFLRKVCLKKKNQIEHHAKKSFWLFYLIGSLKLDFLILVALKN